MKIKKMMKIMMMNNIINGDKNINNGKNYEYYFLLF